MRTRIEAVALAVGLLALGWKAPAAEPAELLSKYAAEAKKQEAAFGGFDAEEGRKFYFFENMRGDGKRVRCASCHTADPKKPGESRAGKPIEPMAVSVNPARFTDEAKVEKWFRRNCDDVFERPCTAKEKGNFIKFLMSVK